MKSVRLALWLWYRGHPFRGFQRQAVGPTVQEALEQALVRLGLSATALPAGRTDRGVHARMQVVSLRAPAGTDVPALGRALAAELAGDDAMGAVELTVASPSFHAQWSATGKEYRYRLLTAELPAWRPFAWDIRADERLGPRPARVERAVELLQRAVGTRDFIAFHEKSSVQKRRTLASVEASEPVPGLIELRLRGDGFARYQVRFLVGSALAASSGRVQEAAFLEALETGAALAGVRAPAEGLVLWEVFYPAAVDPFLRLRASARLPDGPPFEATR